MGDLSNLLQEIAATSEIPETWRKSLNPGDVVGRYQIRHEIGRGGFGAVYEAFDPELGRTVALKALKPGRSRKALPEEWIKKEAEAVAKLDHPAIVTIFDVGTCPAGAYLVMELLRGETLATRIERGPFPVDEALRIGEQMAEGLAHAHSRGVLHRDLKPTNVFVCEDGRVKLLDFGLAHLLGTEGSSGAGTPAYMAPEQAAGQPVDERADVWAAGMVLGEMLTGKRPVERTPHPLAGTEATVANQHGAPQGGAEGDRTEMMWRPPAAAPGGVPATAPSPPPPAVRASLADVPRPVRKLVSSALAVDPSARPADGRAWLASLTSLRKKRSRRRLLVATSVLALVAAASAAWMLRRESRVRWALQEALPQASRYAEMWRFPEAVALADRIAAIVPDDPGLARLRERISCLMDIESVPPGATVWMKPYVTPDADWASLGTTPMSSVRLPAIPLRWRVEKEEYTSASLAAGCPGPSSFPGNEKPGKLVFRLEPLGTIPEDMVTASGGNPPAFGGPPVQIGDYLIDRTEVTNRAFQAFVDAGGYARREFWREPFVLDGRTLSWEEAVDRFRDATGAPGPAGWRDGRFPEGTGDLPVTGVSWFEASAYAEYVGKRLPSVYHWLFASRGLGYLPAKLSNFSREGLAPVGKYPGLGRFGTVDMAGNAKEWCANEMEGGRVTLGAAFDERDYLSGFPDPRSPFERGSTTGFRPIRLRDDRTEAKAWDPVGLAWRNYDEERSVAPEVARAFLRLYDYAPTPLDARVDSPPEDRGEWLRERVSYATAYGERMWAFLYTPKDAKPPFQVVVYFPGSDVLGWRSSDLVEADVNTFSDLLRAGRAVIYPVYKHTLERGDGKPNPGNSPTVRRDNYVAWVKDFRRTVDLVESRSDLDRSRIALYGLSWGAVLGPILLSSEERVRAGALTLGGLDAADRYLPEADPFSFAQLVRQPVLMVNGRYDTRCPLERCQLPMLRALGTTDKRHVALDFGHTVPPDLIQAEVNAFLDRTLGPAR